MMEIYLMVYMYMFIIGNLIFVSKYKHMLITLLSLEFMVLSVFMLFMYYFMKIDYNMFFLMVFLVFSVCEGVLGLSILVSMIRTHGNDYFYMFNILL